MYSGEISFEINKSFLVPVQEVWAVTAKETKFTLKQEFQWTVSELF